LFVFQRPDRPGGCGLDRGLGRGRDTAESLPNAAAVTLDETYVYYATDGAEAAQFADGTLVKVPRHF
jgi:hypothetical protein